MHRGNLFQRCFPNPDWQKSQVSSDMEWQYFDILTWKLRLGYPWSDDGDAVQGDEDDEIRQWQALIIFSHVTLDRLETLLHEFRGTVRGTFQKIGKKGRALTSSVTDRWRCPGDGGFVVKVTHQHLPSDLLTGRNTWLKSTRLDIMEGAIQERAEQNDWAEFAFILWSHCHQPGSRYLWTADKFTRWSASIQQVLFGLTTVQFILCVGAEWQVFCVFPVAKVLPRSIKIHTVALKSSLTRVFQSKCVCWRPRRQQSAEMKGCLGGLIACGRKWSFN